MWKIVIGLAVLVILLSVFIVGTDYSQYLDLQRRLREERERKKIDA